MARFSICGGDDGEGPSNSRSRKRQRLLPSIIEDEEDTDAEFAGSSGEEEEEEEEIRDRGEFNFRGRRIMNDVQGSTTEDSDREVAAKEGRSGKSVNSQSSSSKDPLVSVTLLDPDVLDCPTCCEPLKIPIFQCDNGHLACSWCCIKVRNRCPSCTLPIGYIRCRAMEKVIEASRISCPNAKYGCKENTSYGNRFSHEKLCVFAPRSCPIHNCNYTGSYKNLNHHVRAKHKDNVISFAWNTSLSIRLNLSEKITFLQEEKDGEVIVVQGFRCSHGVYVSVSCVVPSAPGVGKFSCSLTYVTVDNTVRQGLMIKNIQKVRNEQPEDGFMLIPSYMLSGIENLNLKICIGRGRAFVQI